MLALLKYKCKCVCPKRHWNEAQVHLSGSTATFILCWVMNFRIIRVFQLIRGRDKILARAKQDL